MCLAILIGGCAKLKTDSYYFKAFGEYGVSPWQVYRLLNDKLKLTLNDLEAIEKCHRVDFPDNTFYIYSMDRLQDLIYSYGDDVGFKIAFLDMWYQTVQKLKGSVEK